MSWIIKLFITAIAVVMGSYFIPGITVDSFKTALMVAVVLALLNTFVKPVISILSLPITILTLGLFALVINVFIIYMAAYLVDGFRVSGFLTALIFSFALSIFSGILNMIID